MTEIARIISTSIIVVGSLFVLYAIIMFTLSCFAKPIKGQIIDFPYHWTTRGFIRRMRIAYVFNGEERFYDTKVGTLRRQSGPITIRVGKHGYVFERASCLYNFVLGLAISGVGIALLALIK